ncbi:hypothetical protein AZA_62341 [Nitrospirillum viridazoti Y2]|uniref:JAB domain-containing protein n=1 Tax=Nitrospirillum amazonense TaxID=28077 RepID=A0A560IYX1_9PROT|nr:hypothetical protein [Nitrospirillum amazonense]EGY01671.1 hypothetical protein AZA_62341 [Nitrospirillum amazonense Y2]TWB63369.1 hypothetical protein FBZ92_104123 [Nitrospirillum amazonense]
MAEGLALVGVPLLAKGAGGFHVRPAAEVETLLKRAYAGAEPGAAVLPGLTKIADALNRGDLAQAMIRAVHLRLPELDWDAAVRLARANDNLAKYSPDQPRDEDGRWTDGSGVAEAGEPAEAKPKDADGHATPIKPGKKGTDAPTAQPLLRVSTASDFAIPASPAAAPKDFVFAQSFNDRVHTYWQESLAPLLAAHGAKPPVGQKEWVIEEGATIVARKDNGSLELQNEGGLPREKDISEREFRPDLNLKEPGKYILLGTVHTHPYDSGVTGASFSGNDVDYLMSEPISFSFVQSGESQFLFLKTKQTPKMFNHVDVKNYQDKRIHDLGQENPSLSMARASSIANVEVAREYHLAYYEGSNGKLSRVYP